MRKSLKSGAAALMIMCMGGNAWAGAAAGCARPDDLRAVRTAAVQQRLMVAALSCDATELYNNFVMAYQRELQVSDRALQNFFRRLNGRTGTEQYHAFKTRLANASSMQSIGNITEYCTSAKEIFAVALGTARTTLAAFLVNQATSVDDAFAPCPIQTASSIREEPEAKTAPAQAKPTPLGPPRYVEWRARNRFVELRAMNRN